MDPINKLAKACMDDDEYFNKKDKDGNKVESPVEKMLRTLKISLSPEEKELKGKKILKAIIRKWIDAAEAILEMMVTHLPSPKEA